MEKQTIVLGSRGSKLALWQTNYVKGLLETAAPEYDYRVEVVHTKGDKILDVALSKIGDKGLFTKELEHALLDGSVDLCVHSMKDMPTVLPEGLSIQGVPVRANAADALVMRGGVGSLLELPAGARVATGSLRRTAQLKRLRPDIEPCEIRGNIDSRIRRIVEGEFDAGVLACAGIERLGIPNVIAQVISTADMIPAVGQGAIAIEVRSGDERVAALCAAITHEPTMRAVRAERIVLRALEGGCQVPMGVHARDIVDESGDVRMVMDGFVSSLDGVRFVRAHGECVPSEYESMAQGMVDDLLAGGAGPILSELR